VPDATRRPEYPGIPAAMPTLEALTNTVERMREVVELLTGQRNSEGGQLAVQNGFLELKSRTDQASAAVREINEVITSGDSALARRIEQVEAKADGATANGEVYLIAEVDPDKIPSGAVAKYGWRINANATFTGMNAIAYGDGRGEIMFDATSFALQHPSYNGGDPKAVFAYSGGAFTFNVDMVINGNVLINGTVNTEKIPNGAVTSADIVTAPVGSDAQLIMPFRKGARVLVSASTDLGPVEYNQNDKGEVIGRHNLYVNGQLRHTKEAAWVIDMVIRVFKTGSNVTEVTQDKLYRAMPTAVFYEFVIPNDGSYRITFRPHRRRSASQMMVLEAAR
jgi:hypothetical protein